jgi:hypothetical protein
MMLMPLWIHIPLSNYDGTRACMASPPLQCSANWNKWRSVCMSWDSKSRPRRGCLAEATEAPTARRWISMQHPVHAPQISA